VTGALLGEALNDGVHVCCPPRQTKGIAAGAANVLIGPERPLGARRVTELVSSSGGLSVPASVIVLAIRIADQVSAR